MEDALHLKCIFGGSTMQHVTHLHKFVQVELPCKVLAWQQNRVGVLFLASERQN